MPARRYRSRSKKQKNIITPGKISKIHYSSPRTSPKICAGCGGPINSIARVRGLAFHRLSKLKRRPNRMYGGFYCPSCLDKKIKTAVRKFSEEPKE